MAMGIYKEIQNSKLKIKNCIFCLLTTVICILLLAGCQEKAKTPDRGRGQASKSSKPLVGVKQAVSEISIKGENVRLKEQNQQLKEQLETLAGINRPARIEAISTITAIELTSRCSIYDKKSDDGNNTDKKKTLMVYLRPIDDMGDCIKAAGAVKIELWNLDTKPNEALLKSWEIEPKDLRKKWSGSLLTSYYKLPFDVNSILTGKEKGLTLKAEFTDYLTGKILKGQQVVKP
jgi:hypothetical protein